MITDTQIQQVSDEIARQFQPERIILFGSYAYGTPNEDSDVDLLVIMLLPNKGRGKASDIRLHLDVAFPLDLVICDPEYIAQRIEINDYFLQEITKKGEVLYAGDDIEMGRQSRSDWGSANREGQVQAGAHHDLVRCLAQQCAEKVSQSAVAGSQSGVSKDT